MQVFRGTDPPCSQKSSYNLFSALYIQRVNQPQVVQYRSIYSWKKSAYKWTRAVQTHVAQGSTRQ